MNLTPIPVTDDPASILTGAAAASEQVAEEKQIAACPAGAGARGACRHGDARRGRAKSRTTFDMGREPGHPWPLEYVPRRPGDHHPWRIATTSGNGIRFACHEVEESDVPDGTDIQPENSSD